MTFSLVAPSVSLAESSKVSESLNDSTKLAETKVSDRLLTQFKDDDEVTFLVKFSERADSMKVAAEARKNAQKANLSANGQEHAQRSAVISELKATALTSQANVKEFLEKQKEKGAVKDYHSYHIVNGMAVTATKSIAEKIANFAEVEKILPNEQRQLFDSVKEETPDSETQSIEWNIDRVGAPDVWGMGIDGAGVVVANIDTGVEWDHPALMDKYAGYDAATGDVDHTYSFFDPVNGETEPYDTDGHGTHTMGTMVGSETNGNNQVGVAPGAEWIAVQAFTDDGAYDTDLLAAAEWLLAPGGDASKAPDVVNNSWGGGSGLDEWYRDTVIAWRAADIFPAFAAGNTTLFNPGGPGSVAVPSNYPESFAVGATDNGDNLAEFSLRGPSPYDEIKPDISAPGVAVRSSIPGGGYASYNGTSMATPAIAGVVALLESANSSLTVDEIEEILIETAVPMTDSEYPEAPNNGYGHGLVDAFAAVGTVASGLGTIEGQVTVDGEDAEEPVFEHSAPAETYEGMDLDLTVEVSDNISVTSVELIVDGESVEASRISGDYKSGEYEATIPGEIINGETLAYQWVINDFGDNEVTSDEYSITILPGVSVGYSTNFEESPAGWSIFGENSTWERGVPTSGPESAASGEYVYATNPEGTYSNNENSTLVMPPVDLPEGESYLQFEQWYNIENNWDYGHVFISSDMDDWAPLAQFTNTTNGWESFEVDLSEYAGERVYLGFNLDTDGSVQRDGWFIDDVTLSDTSLELDEPTASLGIIGNSDTKKGEKNDTKKGEKVDPSKIKPSIEKDDVAVTDSLNAVHPSLLPLGAQVNVLESDRSVATNPADGSYSFMHPAGDFTLVAEAYGYHSEEQSVSLADDETVTANFTLEELPQATVNGTVTSANSGDPVEGASLLLVEDANVEPVETDEDGNYELTAYEGTYTLKVIARDFHSKEMEVNFDEDQELNIELEPLFTYPGGEIGYDDGTAENARAYYDAGNKWAVKMSLPEGQDSAIVTDGVFQFHGTDWPTPGDTPFAVEVWDATGEDGLPGEKLAGPIDAEAIRSLDEWTVVDLRDQNIQVEGDFYMVYVQTGANPNVPGLATDESSENAGRSYQSVSGAWSPSPAAEGNYMIRARIAHTIEKAEITSPSEGVITNESELTVEGTASPTTTISLLNNGEEVDTVDIDENGTFELPAELTEGENVLTVVTYSNGEEVNISEPVTVTLDTEAPELTIDNPVDGDKTNRETVSVEGTIADENLENVEVNGAEASVTDGSYSKRIILEEGENEIEVVATDAAGNQAAETITIEADYTAPVIENVTPTEDQEVKAGETVVIEFDSEADLTATFSMLMPLTNINVQNATELPMMETSEGHYVGYWTAPGDLVAEGAVIQVKVIDDFGNETMEEAEGKVSIVEDNGNGKGKGKGNGKDNPNKGKGNNSGKGKGSNK
ncbi:peptidase S8 [Oceanobacillus halophilus]|uniref:Peptidase S8 n=2 Tax=Oceanobacillus halophilus TaxID=930130 RepID=A0A494ZV13_9BACI|nr:peptidase S8 [Oceanobacillus halophilus]